MSAASAARPLDVHRMPEVRASVRYLNLARLIAMVGVLCLPFSLWGLFWSSPRDYPFLSSMMFVPLAIYGCVLLFNRVWRGDKLIKSLFAAGIAARLAAAGLYVYTGFFVFNSAVDAFHYWTTGVTLADQFAEFGWAVFRPPWSSTNLICNLAGIITLVTGNAMPTLFVLFSLAALWGGYFFYRAFCIAFPDGNRGLYGLLVICLPSIVFWSSAVGKDALEQLFIGVAAYGFAKLIRQLSARSIFICIIGLAGSAMVRPHVGAMLATSMLFPFAVGKTRGGWMTTSAKLLLVPVLAAGTYFMISQAQTFVGVEGSDYQSTVDRLKAQTKYSDTGGSTFNQGESMAHRVMQGPFLIFRPFPWEVHNAMSAIAALEGVGLLLFAWYKRKEVWALIRQWRQAYVLFVLLFTLEFSLVFSASTSNFGILARERIMVVPFFLMIFCAKLREKKAAVVPAVHHRFKGHPMWHAPQLDRPLS
jgi:hypothetical protein